MTPDELFRYAADLSRAEARRVQEKPVWGRKPAPARRVVATGKRLAGRWLYAVDGEWLARSGKNERN